MCPLLALSAKPRLVCRPQVECAIAIRVECKAMGDRRALGAEAERDVGDLSWLHVGNHLRILIAKFAKDDIVVAGF